MVRTAKSAAESDSETTSRILDAARELFLRDGYTGVNLDRIATSAGVARQTLFRAMVDRHWSRLQAGRAEDLVDETARS